MVHLKENLAAAGKGPLDSSKYNASKRGNLKFLSIPPNLVT